LGSHFFSLLFSSISLCCNVAASSTDFFAAASSAAFLAAASFTTLKVLKYLLKDSEISF
jgi:hypothetical protein